jgi:hypothetical protein
MENLVIRIDNDGILHIEVDLNQTIGESGSGRSEVVSCSKGNLPLVNPDGSYRRELLNFSIARRKPGTKSRRWMF